jgi:hypothetical protein
MTTPRPNAQRLEAERALRKRINDLYGQLLATTLKLREVENERRNALVAAKHRKWPTGAGQNVAAQSVPASNRPRAS